MWFQKWIWTYFSFFIFLCFKNMARIARFNSYDCLRNVKHFAKPAMFFSEWGHNCWAQYFLFGFVTRVSLTSMLSQELSELNIKPPTCFSKANGNFFYFKVWTLIIWNDLKLFKLTKSILMDILNSTENLWGKYTNHNLKSC